MIYHCRSLEIPPLKNQTRPATFHSISNTSYCSQRPITIRCLIVRPAFHCSSIDFQFSKYRSPKRGPVSETLSFAIFFLPYCNHYLFLSVWIRRVSSALSHAPPWLTISDLVVTEILSLSFLSLSLSLCVCTVLHPFLFFSLSFFFLSVFSFTIAWWSRMRNEIRICDELLTGISLSPSLSHGSGHVFSVLLWFWRRSSAIYPTSLLSPFPPPPPPTYHIQSFSLFISSLHPPLINDIDPPSLHPRPPSNDPIDTLTPITSITGW